MTERRHNSRSLARRLDEVLPPDRVGKPATDEDPLVDVALQLSASPPFEPLKPEAKARIRSQVLAAYRQQMVSDAHGNPQIPAIMRWVGIAAAGLIILVAGLLLISVVPDFFETSSGVTTAPLPTATFTVTPDESGPEVVRPPASPVPNTIVVEGEIEMIQANTITVFSMDIEVDPNAPILARIRVGDHVRVEGEIVATEDAMMIVAVNITVVDTLSAEKPGTQLSGPPIVVPPGCELTGIGTDHPQLECSER